MLVAIDTNGLYTARAGVATYIRGLLHGLQLMGGDAPEWFELAWPVYNLTFEQPARSIKTFYRELIWARTAAPLQLKRKKATLLHSTAYWFVAPPPGVRVVVTLHDLALLRYPERLRRWHRIAGLRRLRKVGAADRVICISRFTADEAMRLLDIPASRLEVVYNGCPFHPEEGAPAESPPVERVPDEFFLFVGSLEPGKNLKLLRQAYLEAESKGKELPALVIVGARWRGVAGEGEPPKNWHYLGGQPDEALVYLYRRALGLVFPSVYEGFGLPVVEAMALGCPVICSPVSSLPEVGEGAAYFVELRPAAYLDAMMRLSRDTGFREELIEAGLRRCKHFSWRKAASETAEIYRDVAG
ncbi:MAG: glycosyltransferase family 4 protein [Verrucomicrobia bacterium]|nr:glycosyltransferase family 4 protein [Verrucomicrobiota bacterium]MCF7708702.1 glycosyltransferase family 4 protein [Verrucomicrobiota bacterium]